MTRTNRTLAACSVALTVLAASSALAQVADSTRPTPPPMRGGAGPGAGIRSRMAPDDARPARPARPGVQRSRRDGRGRGGDFGPGAPGRGASFRGNGGPRALLRGITLSTDQEKALRAGQARHLMANKPLMLEMMSARTDEQLARLNGDQKALDAASARLSATRVKLDSLRSLRSPTDDLRAVLTADQQKILDRNLAEQATARPMNGRAGGARGAMGPRGFREGVAPRGPRGIVRPGRSDGEDVNPIEDAR
jgi:hypothetical protein